MNTQKDLPQSNIPGFDQIQAPHTSTPWTVFQCSFAKQEDITSACGFNGETLDMSHDECHHPLSLANAAFIVRAVNSHEELLAWIKSVKTWMVVNGWPSQDIEKIIAKAEEK